MKETAHLVEHATKKARLRHIGQRLQLDLGQLVLAQHKGYGADLGASLHWCYQGLRIVRYRFDIVAHATGYGNPDWGVDTQPYRIGLALPDAGGHNAFIGLVQID